MFRQRKRERMSDAYARLPMAAALCAAFLLCSTAQAETVTRNGFDISLSREGLCGHADVCCNDMKNQGKVTKYFCLPNLVKFKDIFGLTKGTPRDKAIWDLAGELTHYYE